MTDLEMQQQPDRYRYYITNDTLLKGAFPYMGESDRVRESIKPLTFENGAVAVYGFPIEKRRGRICPPRRNRGIKKTLPNGKGGV